MPKLLRRTVWFHNFYQVLCDNENRPLILKKCLEIFFQGSTFCKHLLSIFRPSCFSEFIIFQHNWKYFKILVCQSVCLMENNIFFYLVENRAAPLHFFYTTSQNMSYILSMKENSMNVFSNELCAFNIK